MNKIEIITQPESGNHSSQMDIAQKLQVLIKENPSADDNNSDDTTQSSSSDLKQTHGKESSRKIQSTDLTKEKLDHDGFEIPQGKIPLDGHFSTKEVQQLVDLAKSENMLKENVKVVVAEENKTLGDKVIIKEVTDAQTTEKEENASEDKPNDNDDNSS